MWWCKSSLPTMQLNDVTYETTYNLVHTQEGGRVVRGETKCTHLRETE